LQEGMTEERNMCETARLVAAAALARRESRGGHYRSDYPKAKGDEPLGGRTVGQAGDERFLSSP